MKIGTKLYRVRTDRGMSQNEFARLLGLSQPTYSRYERDEISVNGEQLQRFAKSLNVEVSELLPDNLSFANINTSGLNNLIVYGSFYYYANTDSATTALEAENAILKQQIDTLLAELKKDRA